MVITLDSVSLYRAGNLLLDNVNATIHAGQRVGLIGANGAGKSSLFALLTGALQSDQGNIRINQSCSIAHMTQEMVALDNRAIDYVLDGDQSLRALERAITQAEASQQYDTLAELHEQLLQVDGYTARARAEQLLVGLGFSHQAVQENVKHFSGGWRMRLNLARTLMKPADIVLLDEPTNHLDLPAIVWLEGYLQKRSSTLVVISHDRDFLDAVTDTTLHIEHKNIRCYQGGYSAFERLRAEQLAQQHAAYEKQQQQKAHMARFVDRFRAKASKAKQVQSRLKAIEKLNAVAPAYLDSPFYFCFLATKKVTSSLLTLAQAQLGYNQEVLLTADLSIFPGSRIGLLGANGAGKSTLIKSLVGDIPLLSGHRLPSAQLRVGYFAQHQLDYLDVKASPLLHLQRLSPDAREQSLRDFLGSFGFQGNKTVAAVAGFSGGERARLALALMVWQQPNLLLLDEPTNHLDLDMRHALTVALQSFTGAMLLVSHDRHLLRSSTDELWLVHDGKVAPFPDDLDTYSTWLTQQHRQQKARAVSTTPVTPCTKAQRTGASKNKRKALQLLQRQSNQLERDIEQIQQTLTDIETQLTDHRLYTQDNPGQLNQFLIQQKQLQQALNTAEAAWLSLAEQLEKEQG